MMKDIWKSGMMGLITGDALGVPVPFMSRSQIAKRPEGSVTGLESGGVFDMPEGTWSDDSSMAVATMVSLMEKGRLDTDDIMKRFASWLYDGEYTPFGQSFDEGITCSEAIGRYAETGDASSCGRKGEHANGNGALMRILPVCLYYYAKQKYVCTSDDEAIYGIHAAAALTHDHLRSNICCGMYFFMVKSILDSSGSMQERLQSGIDQGCRYYARDLGNLGELAHLDRIKHLDIFAMVSEREIRSSGYVIDSIEAAVWCLITTATLRECLLKAVNLGDDTDTVAAIAGGLAGLYYGYEAIPEEWLAAIKKREWLEGLCSKACSMMNGRDI